MATVLLPPPHALRPLCACGNRLSVADVDGKCLWCATAPHVSTIPYAQLCAECHANPRASAGNSYCRTCSNERNRAARARRREERQARRVGRPRKERASDDL